ncbi:MAG: cupin domain-containing protein [Alphaproteobacteria bacterium]|nr:MAG: cupin domain-containing protein [Alphaproteobacteria bacterium]
MEAEQIIARLGLSPHPEGGWYAETWRGPPGPDGRAVGTAIHFLLEAHQHSHWHRVDATELWLWQLGAPVELAIGRRRVTLGPDLAAGQRLQGIVPPDVWQAARPLGGWALVSCIVAPGFSFAGFTLAPPGWAPDLAPGPDPDASGGRGDER